MSLEKKVGNYRHGMRHTPTYESWCKMKQRCNNPKSNRYYVYGGRGIRVCTRWSNFVEFYLDMGERPEGKTLDRINNDLGYFPENCRWATTKEQMNNKSTNLAFTGVSFLESSGRWRVVSSKAGNKRIHIGHFRTYLAACYARHAFDLGVYS